MLDVLRIVLHGVLPALAATLLLFGVFGRRWLGLALALGFFVSFALLNPPVEQDVFFQLPRWPHETWATNNDAKEWLLWSVVLFGVLSPLGGTKLPHRATIPLAGLLLAAQVFAMLTNRRSRLPLGENVLLHGAAVATFVLVYVGLRRASSHRAGLGLAIAWTACFTVDAVVLVLTGSALLAQLAGVAATVVGTAALTALWRRPLTLGPHLALPLAAAHCGLLLVAHVFGDLPAVAGLLVALAPAAVAFDRGRRAEQGNRLWGTLLAAGLLVAALLLVLPAA